MKQRANYTAICAFFTLVIQNTSLVFAMKHSYRTGASDYCQSSVVIMSETVKLLTCSLMVRFKKGDRALHDLFRELPKKLHLALPSILYVVQNLLLLEAVHTLSPTAYMVCSQGKIFTTAIFSCLILKTRLNTVQVLAIIQLFIGIVLVQIFADSGHVTEDGSPSLEILYGTMCVFVACCTSGFSGVFLEKNFKSPDACMWGRNVQLSVFALPVCYCLSIVHEKDKQLTFFSGFDTTILFVIVLQALGGLITAVIMKYASTLLKCFAVSVSICLSALVSVIVQQEVMPPLRVSGILLVNTSVFLYACASTKM